MDIDKFSVCVSNAEWTDILFLWLLTFGTSETKTREMKNWKRKNCIQSRLLVCYPPFILYVIFAFCFVCVIFFFFFLSIILCLLTARVPVWVRGRRVETNLYSYSRQLLLLLLYFFFFYIFLLRFCHFFIQVYRMTTMYEIAQRYLTLKIKII